MKYTTSGSSATDCWQKLAQAWGAETVIATTSAENLEYVRELGVDHAIDYRSQNWWEAAMPSPRSCKILLCWRSCPMKAWT